MKKRNIPILFARLALAKFLKKKMPISISWEITKRCNRHCTYCDSPMINDNNKELTLKEINKISDELGRSSVLLVSITGGEPLIREDIGKIVSHLSRKNGIKISINTNGSFIPVRLDELKYVSFFNVSLDGKEDVHDAIRGRGSYKDAINGINSLSVSGKRFNIVTVLHRQNSKEEHIKHLIELARYYRTRISFQPVQNACLASSNPHNLSAPDKDLKKIILLICEIKKREPRLVANNRESLLYFLPGYLRHKVPCYAGTFYCRLSHNGFLYACDWHNYTSYEPFKEKMISLHKYSFDTAFRMLPKRSCDNCAGVGVIRFNLALSLRTDAILNILY